MWLLNAHTYGLEYFQGNNIPPYAILSHRWDQDELTFDDARNSRGIEKKGFEKVKKCCQQAITDAGVNSRLPESRRVSNPKDPIYVWVDTCCIDKSNSSELSEAINSMYRWYERARVCYAYLGDVRNDRSGTLADSSWFTRCWTLQELLAPDIVHFYDQAWSYMGDKYHMASTLTLNTDIPLRAIQYFDPDAWSIAERMSWAAGRSSTREEDQAYSLLGIFKVNMPMIYGEGSRAFQRLQEEIVRKSEDLTIFAWSQKGLATDSVISSMLAASTSYYKKQQILFKPFVIREEIEKLSLKVQPPTHWQGIAMMSAGVSIDLFLIPYARNLYLAPIASVDSPRRLPQGVLGDSLYGASITRLWPNGTYSAGVVCMILDHDRRDGFFRRMSIRGNCIFYFPEEWLKNGQYRRVILTGRPMAALTYPIRLDTARYGFCVEAIDVISNQWANYGSLNGKVHLFSSASVPSSRSRKELLLMPGYHGVAGLIRIDLTLASEIIVFGYDSDFNIFGLVIRPDIPCYKSIPLRDLKISAPRFGRHGVSIASKVDMLELVSQLQLRRGTDLSLQKDNVAYNTLPWKDDGGEWMVEGFGRIVFEKVKKTRFFVRVSISLGYQDAHQRTEPVSNPQTDDWFVNPWSVTNDAK